MISSDLSWEEIDMVESGQIFAKRGRILVDLYQTWLDLSRSVPNLAGSKQRRPYHCQIWLDSTLVRWVSWSGQVGSGFRRGNHHSTRRSQFQRLKTGTNRWRRQIGLRWVSLLVCLDNPGHPVSWCEMFHMTVVY